MREQRQESEWILSCQSSFEVIMRMHRGSVQLLFFAIVVDVVTEFAREGSLSELLYADETVPMRETIEDSEVL